MTALTGENRDKVAIGAVYVPAPGARLPLAGPLDDGSCRTWQFCAHAEEDGSVAMRDTYWRGLRPDPHDRLYRLDDSNFEEMFPMFELAVDDLASWRRVGFEESRRYADADVFRVDAGSKASSYYVVRPGAVPPAAYEVAARRAALDRSVARAKAALADAARGLAALEEAVAAAESSGEDWTGGRAGERDARAAGNRGAGECMERARELLSAYPG